MSAGSARSPLPYRRALPDETPFSGGVAGAQGVGLAFALIGTIGYAAGFTTAVVIVTCLALGAAFLNAAFGVCLGSVRPRSVN